MLLGVPQEERQAAADSVGVDAAELGAFLRRVTPLAALDAAPAAPQPAQPPARRRSARRRSRQALMLPVHLLRHVAGFLTARASFSASAASPAWLAAWRPARDWSFVRCAEWMCSLPGKRFRLVDLFSGALEPPEEVFTSCPGEPYTYEEGGEAPVLAFRECCGREQGSGGCMRAPHSPKLASSGGRLREGDAVWVLLHQARRQRFTSLATMRESWGESGSDSDSDAASDCRAAALLPKRRMLACGLALPVVERTALVRGTVASAPGRELGLDVADVRLSWGLLARKVPLHRLRWRACPSVAT